MNFITRFFARRYIRMHFPMQNVPTKSWKQKYFDLVEEYHKQEIELRRYRMKEMAEKARAPAFMDEADIVAPINIPKEWAKDISQKSRGEPKLHTAVQAID